MASDLPPEERPVLVGVPCEERLWARTAQRLVLLCGKETPSGSGLRLIRQGLTVADKRNAAVKSTLEGDFGWMLCTDSDMILPPDTFRRLARHDVPVIGAACVGRRPPYQLMWRSLEGDTTELSVPPADDEGLKEVEVCGTGCLLVRRDVLEAVGPEPFEVDGRGIDEDFRFCRLARNHGFPVYVDRQVRPGHIGGYGFDVRHHAMHEQGFFDGRDYQREDWGY